MLGEVGYGLVRQTRSNRAFAFTYKHKSWLDSMPPPTAATVKALASQFAKAGTEALETPHIFSTPEVIKAGGILALELFGDAAVLLVNTKERLFAGMSDDFIQKADEKTWLRLATSVTWSMETPTMKACGVSGMPIIRIQNLKQPAKPTNYWAGPPVPSF